MTTGTTQFERNQSAIAPLAKMPQNGFALSLVWRLLNDAALFLVLFSALSPAIAKDGSVLGLQLDRRRDNAWPSSYDFMLGELCLSIPFC